MSLGLSGELRVNENVQSGRTRGAFWLTRCFCCYFSMKVSLPCQQAAPTEPRPADRRQATGDRHSQCRHRGWLLGSQGPESPLPQSGGSGFWERHEGGAPSQVLSYSRFLGAPESESCPCSAWMDNTVVEITSEEGGRREDPAGPLGAWEWLPGAVMPPRTHPPPG